MYYLQNNVEIVAGAKKYCIYDLNSQKLYSLDFEDIRVIDLILSNTVDSKSAVSSDTGKYLLNEGIIVEENALLPKVDRKTYRFAATFAWIEITQNCNLLCRHCYEGSSREERKPVMQFEHFKSAVDSLKLIGVDRIQLVGGEPLMHPDIEQMIEYVKGRFSFVEIFTNGTLLTDRLLSIIKSANISLAFSVYSDNPELHDYVTKTNCSHKKTNNQIKKAVDIGIPVRVASVEMRNIPSFQFPISSVLHRTDLPRLTGRANLSLYSREMLQRKLITQNTFMYPIQADTYYRNKVLHNCFGERLYIDCNSNVYPCAMERRVTYGNLKTMPIDQIIKNDLPTLTKDKIHGCKNCEYRYACYDCRCDANGAAIDDKPWYCTYDQNSGIWLDIETFIDNLLKGIPQIP